MKNEFTKQEKEFFKNYKCNDSLGKSIAIGVLFLLGFGVCIDAVQGFQILRHSKSVFHGIFGLILLVILYFIGETIGEWVNSKDDVSHPLYKRVSHLILLLFSVWILGVIYLLIIRFTHGW